MEREVFLKRYFNDKPNLSLFKMEQMYLKTAQSHFGITDKSCWLHLAAIEKNAELIIDLINEGYNVNLKLDDDTPLGLLLGPDDLKSKIKKNLSPFEATNDNELPKLLEAIRLLIAKGAVAFCMSEEIDQVDIKEFINYLQTYVKIKLN